ncbi:MAG: hypothetical protein AB3N14_05395, partial [Flavobacteriaceae bacterium]
SLSSIVNLNINEFILNVEINAFKELVITNYSWINITLFSLASAICFFTPFKGRRLRLALYALIFMPFGYYVIIETVLTTNQIAVAHFRAISIQPNKENIVLFAELIRALPENPLALFTDMSDHRTLSYDSCQHIRALLARDSLHETSFNALCNDNNAPSRAIFKYSYIGLMSFLVTAATTFFVVTEHINFYDKQANK